MIIHNNNQADIDSTQHSNITHDLQHPPCFYSVFCYLATMSDCLDSFTLESGLKSCIPSARTAPLPLSFFTGSSFFSVFSLSYISKSLLANTLLTSSQCLENFFYVVTALCACVNMFAAYWPSKLIGIFFGYSLFTRSHLFPAIIIGTPGKYLFNSVCHFLTFSKLSLSVTS